MTGTLTVTPSFTSAWNSGATAGATACAQQACSDIGALLFLMSGNAFTQNIIFDWQSLGGPVASSVWGIETIKIYSDYRTAYLGLTGLNSLQTLAYTTGNLPVSSFFTGGTVTWSQLAIANSLGILNSGSDNSATVTLSSGNTWDTDLHGTSCVGANALSMYGIIWNEVTEVLVRFANCGGNNTFYMGDFWTYSSAETRNFTSTGSRYMSNDGGTTNVASLSQNVTGDFGDTNDSAN